MTPHDAHEYFEPDPCEYEEAWHELVEAEADRALDNMSPAEERRYLLRRLSAAIGITVSGTPLHLDD